MKRIDMTMNLLLEYSLFPLVLLFLCIFKGFALRHFVCVSIEFFFFFWRHLVIFSLFKKYSERSHCVPSWLLLAKLLPFGVCSRPHYTVEHMICGCFTVSEKSFHLNNKSVCVGKYPKLALQSQSVLEKNWLGWDT